MSKKVLVTGGLGYIGSHTVVELQNAGFEVVVIDNLSNSNIKILDQIEKITGIKPAFDNLDLSNESSVLDYFKNNTDIENIIHFAAYKAVGESVQEPVRYYKNNIYSLINILSSFKDRKLNIVFSSSCTVYGQPSVLPVTEKTEIQKAMSPYGNTKQICEEILQDASKTNTSIKVIALRYFNPVGAHNSGLIGELPIGVPQNLVPFITQSAIGKRGGITVYGKDYNTPDGTCIRDYIHVVDLAQAHISSINRMSGEGGGFEVYNVGTGKGSSVLEVINTFEKVNDVKLNYNMGERREGDIEKIWGDATLAKEKLGWEAKLGLEEMLSSAWKWEKYLKDNQF